MSPIQSTLFTLSSKLNVGLKDPFPATVKHQFISDDLSGDNCSPQLYRFWFFAVFMPKIKNPKSDQKDGFYYS